MLSLYLQGAFIFISLQNTGKGNPTCSSQIQGVPDRWLLWVTAALPFLLCGMSSVRSSAQVFPLWTAKSGGGKTGVGREKRGERERRKRKREHPANVDMTEALKSPLRQWGCRAPGKGVPCSPQTTASSSFRSTRIQRSQPSVWRHKLMGVTVYRLQKGILLLTDCTKLRFKRGRDNM